MEQKQVNEFRVQDLLPIGMTIIVLGIGLAFGLNVMGDVKNDMTSGSPEWIAANETVTGVAKIPSKLPLIVTVVIAAVIIGILVTYLLVRFR